MSTATTTTARTRADRRCVRIASGGHPGSDRLGERLAAGDDAVSAELYRVYGGRILGLALHVLNDRQLAEEAVQETILRVWRGSATFDATQELEPWLFRTARNTAYDMSRARSRRPRAQRGDPEASFAVTAEADRSGDPAVAVEQLALRWAVRAAIDELPEVERTVVRLQHLDGLGHREIADRLGISIGTVKSRSHRAHRKLSVILRRVGSIAHDAA